MFYSLLRRILFLFDAENVHHFTMGMLKVLCKIPFIRPAFRSLFSSEGMQVNAFGLTFKNPVGLAAGFDKNAKYLHELSLLGFGFIEVGTVTPQPQKGNDKPRLFRLPKDKALINRMGFNNDGVEVIAERLRQFRKSNSERIIIGGNLGKNKITSNENAWKDYEICFLKLADVVDYFVVNVSSPNTPGLRDLQQKDALGKILKHLISLRQTRNILKPIFLKIAPDLNQNDLNDILDLIMEIKLDGLVINNTTISREGCITEKKRIENIGAGGLSGAPLSGRSNELLKYIVEKTQHKIPVIGSGGIMNAGDAQQRFKAGATLIQVFTGFIYSGPSLVRKIVNRLRNKIAE